MLSPHKLDCVSRVNSIGDYTDTVSFSKDFVTEMTTLSPEEDVATPVRNAKEEVILKIKTNPDENGDADFRLSSNSFRSV